MPRAGSSSATRSRPSGTERGFWKRIWSALRALGSELGTEATLATILVTLVLVKRVELGGARGHALLAPVWRAAARAWPLLAEPLLQRQAIAILLQLAVPVAAILLYHRPRHGQGPGSYGLGLGDLRFWGPLTAVVFAVQVLVVWLFLSRDPVYVARYPSLAAARRGGSVFWAWETSRVLYMISWEFLFRGYLLYALVRRAGLAALAVQTMPFALMHIVSAKPASEVFFTVVSGLASGLLVLEAGSIWPVVFLHAAGAVCLDVFIVFR